MFTLAVGHTQPLTGSRYVAAGAHSCIGKNACSHASTPPCAFMVWFLFNHKDKFVSSVQLMWPCFILISIRIDILTEVNAGLGVISYLSFRGVACGQGLFWIWVEQ